MKYLLSFFSLSFTINAFAAEIIPLSNTKLADLFVARAENQELAQIIPQLDWGNTYVFKTGNALELLNMAQDTLMKYKKGHANIQTYPVSALKHVSEYSSAYERVIRKSSEGIELQESFFEIFESKTAMAIGYMYGPQFTLFYDAQYPEQSTLFFTLDGTTPQFVREFHTGYIEKACVDALKK